MGMIGKFGSARAHPQACAPDRMAGGQGLTNGEKAAAPLRIELARLRQALQQFGKSMTM
jgi:hypothetical protein